jgi:hypothetical protein
MQPGQVGEALHVLLVVAVEPHIAIATVLVLDLRKSSKEKRVQRMR